MRRFLCDVVSNDFLCQNSLREKKADTIQVHPPLLAISSSMKGYDSPDGIKITQKGIETELHT